MAHFWNLLPFLLLAIPLALWAACHAILYKRDVRAAFAWAVFSCVLPIAGPLFYWLFGINRIQRRAIKLRRSRVRLQAPLHQTQGFEHQHSTIPSPDYQAMDALSKLVERLVDRPLLSGNVIYPLHSGDEAYPAMCEAIEQAQESVTLVTYIFDNDKAGKMFVEALTRAHRRGVEVRVLVDAVGRRYSWPSIDNPLTEAGIPTDLFMKPRHFFKMKFINLRNHRKILVVDGKIGFTGGINIREGHMLSLNPSHPVQDLHFRVEGPVVAHLQEAFAEDWAFTNGEILEGEQWFPELEARGDLLARGIPDGPDEDFDKLRWTILGALAAARQHVRIITPYFLPDQTMIMGLNLAAMRGVKVEIILPEKSNLPTVQWAMNGTLWQVLQHGCRVFLTPPPFDHSKVMVVDRHWVLLGSANWDPRSLRLNFEFNVETYDTIFASGIHDYLGQVIQRSRGLSLGELNARPFGQRLRDGFFRLFSPYM